LLVLAIESSTPQASVAIGSEQGIVASALISKGGAYNEFLLPAIRFCLDQSGLGFRNIGGIAVSLGPGLHTGMRVGVATAKALSQSLSVPIVGMASLDLLAYEVRYSPKTICATLDARRGEVFNAFYKSSPGGIQRMSEYRINRPGQLAVGLESRPEEVLLVGSGALLYRKEFEDIAVVELATMSQSFPDARALVELSLPRLYREEYDSLYDLKPLYLRQSAQRIRWERIQGRRSA
jgi:tRNA threonylcarbamoyladenosine biosynthesis protein TsaB